MNLTKDDNLTRLLLQTNILSAQEIAQFQQQAEIFKQTLFQFIVQHKLIDAKILAQHCAQYFQLSYFPLENYAYHTAAIQEFSLSILKNYFIFPVEKKEKEWVIAIANPNDIALAKNLSFQLDTVITLVFVRYDILYRFHNTAISTHAYQPLSTKKESSAQTLAHAILCDAIHRSASDIHIEPYQHHLRIRFRLDGLLHETIRLPNHLTDAVTSCLKVLANLDISIKRLPQDGRLTFQTQLGFFKNCRVNTCPTQYGEKMVIRLLNSNAKINTIDELGLTQSDQKIILKTIEKPQGLILVTGPTGSGKTITLYTLLNLLNHAHRNIATIEDPIEMQIEGINQTAVNNKSGFTFSQALRALLRQDPDVIMIGEIRDTETAEMAIRAAQTGHLVLSTLHTNSAAEAITRLTHMGIASHHIASALTLVIAQRLVRCLCHHCKNTTENSCIHCSNGFSGRIGVFELLPMHPEIKQMIFEARSYLELAKKNQALGYENLWEVGMRLVNNGVTDVSELYRVIEEV